MVVDLQFSALQLVADEQVLDDRQDFLAAQEIVASPPALEIQEALALSVDVGEDLVVLVPERVRRAQVLKVLHQPGAVEPAVAQVGQQVPFVKNPDLTISAYGKEASKKAGGDLTIKRFVRFELGSGIEKKIVDFAAEVAAQTKGH